MIHHFYHIYADGQWREPVEEHVRALKESGLGEELLRSGSFWIGLVGSDKNRDAVIEYMKATGLTFGVCAQASAGWEQVSMIPMWQHSQHYEGLILYAHTKGAYSPIDVNVRWRRSMTYWNVIRWRDCVEKLKECDMVGTHWIYPTINMPEHKFGNPMMAGTFYWVRAEQMRTWMRPPLTHRWEAEGWCGYRYVQKPWLIWDWTPYFPNSNHFADGWVNDPGFVGVDTGVSVAPVVLHGKEVPNE